MFAWIHVVVYDYVSVGLCERMYMYVLCMCVHVCVLEPPDVFVCVFLTEGTVLARGLGRQLGRVMV